MGLRACTARAFDATCRARHEDRVKQEAQDVPKRGPTLRNSLYFSELPSPTLAWNLRKARKKLVSLT